MYEKGRGVTRDEKKAVEWLAKATDQGDKEAKIALETLKNNPFYAWPRVSLV
jgi:TPR repeat protein